MECPICNKPDIGDFTKEPTICPQCNSNLKGYLLVEKSKIGIRKKLRIHSISFVLLVLILSLILVGVNINRPKQLLANADQAANEIYSDSIAFYRNELKSVLNSLSAKEEKEIEIAYIVKSGDSFSKIAYMFYGDFNLYPQIQERNRINGSHIEPGDTLIVKLYSND